MAVSIVKVVCGCSNFCRCGRSVKLKVRVLLMCSAIFLIFLCRITVLHWSSPTDFTDSYKFLKLIANPNFSVLHDVRTVLREPSPEFACQEAPKSPSAHVLLMVISSPEDTQRRSVIRSTIQDTMTQWESHLLKQISLDSKPMQLLKVLFFMGTSPDNTISVMKYNTEVEQEWSEHEDIIVDDFVEHYFNLTLKTMRMLKWVHGNCANDVNYIVKIDDDVFLNIPRLLEFLLLQGTPTLVAGHVYVHPEVIRDKSSKWFTPVHVYPNDTFPSYTSGPCYVLGIDAVTLLFEESRHVPLLHMEDVYVTGMLTSRLNLNLTQLGSNRLMLVWSEMVNSLEWFLNKTIIHPVTPVHFQCWTKHSFPSGGSTSKWPNFLYC